MISERIIDLEKMCDEDQEINDVYTFNFRNTVKRIYAYLNSTFYSCSDPSAIFYNIVNDRSHHFAKNIDLDTKDLQPYGIGEVKFYQSWVANVKLQQWFEQEKIAVKLNDLAERVSDYGSSIIKLVKKDGKITWEYVNLMNISFDPLIDSIRNTDKVEYHYLTKQKLEEKGWFREDMKTDEEYCDKYKIWEYWGYIDEDFKQIIGYGEGKDAIELSNLDMSEDDDPYYDFHLTAYKGRWLRVGVVERLFKIQEQVNRLVNYNEKNNEIASLLLLRTSDPNTNGNVLAGVESGQIINSADLQQIGITNTYLNEFIAQLQQLGARADELCYTPQIVRGENLPSGTPFRSTAVMSNNAKSSFRFIRERIGETLGYILKEKILPSIVSTWNKGEVVDISENLDDIRIFEDYYKLQLIREYYDEKISKGEFVEVNELANYVETNIANLDRMGRKINIAKKFFDFKWGIKFNITGEGVDKAQRNGAYESILQWIQANPAIQNNPYFRQYVESNGITPIRMSAQEINQLQQSQTTAPSISEGEDKLLSAVDTQ